jgi:phage-related protein
MATQWNVEYLDLVSFHKLLLRYRPAIRVKIALLIDTQLTVHGQDSVATGFSRPLGKGLYELKISLRPDVEMRVFFAARAGRKIIVLSAYDKKNNDSKNWQNGQIQLARALLKSLE